MEDLTMAMKETWNSVKQFFTKAGKKNLIIVCAVVLIGAAVWVNWMFFSDDDGDGFTYSGGTGMNGRSSKSVLPR